MFSQSKRGHLFCFTLLLTFTLPGMSQVLKLPPTVYSSGGAAAHAVALADVNKDGNLDAIIVNNTGPGSIGVMFGNGDGTLQAAATYPSLIDFPTVVAVGDFNEDGSPDLALAGGTEQCSLCFSVLLNNGDGTFKAAVGFPSNGGGGTSIQAADVNGDGHLDLIITNECAVRTSCGNGAGSVDVFLGKGDGTFGADTSYAFPNETIAVSLVVVDLNHDGKPDLLFSGNIKKFVGVRLNAGDGTFPKQVNFPLASGGAGAIVAEDVNGDGNLDAIVVNTFTAAKGAGGSVDVLLGNGDGTFQTPVAYDAGVYPSSVATADFNGDGHPDIIVTSGNAIGSTPKTNGNVEVLMNNGDGTFALAPTTYTTAGVNALSVAVGKLNADANPDVVVAEQCDGFKGTCPMGGVAVLLGKADKTKTVLASSSNPSSVGQAVTFTGTFTAASAGPIPDGTTIKFLIDGKNAGTATTMNGMVTLTTSSLKQGTHRVNVKYPSSAFFTTSSATVEQVVN